MINRRSALKQFMLAGMSAPLLSLPALAATKPNSSCARSLPAAQYQFGVAMVSLKELPLANAIESVKRLGISDVSLHRGHAPWDSSSKQLTAVAQRVRAAGLEPKVCGVIYVKNDEAEMRRRMEYVRALGVNLFTCSPEPEALPLLARMVEEYDLRVAIHNHGPEDKHFPTAESIAQKIAPFGTRLGICLDVGHAYRAGTNPATDIKRYGARIFDVHLKDTLSKVGEDDVAVEMGRGVLDLLAVLAALATQGYAGHAWLEYEKDPTDPVPGLAESLGYVRGLQKNMAVF